MRETLWAGCGVLFVMVALGVWLVERPEQGHLQAVADTKPTGTTVVRNAKERIGALPREHEGGTVTPERSLDRVLEPEQPSGPDEVSLGPARLSLRVVEALRGAGVARAQLRLLGHERAAECWTDALGFVDVVLRPDVYSITSWAPDHEPTTGVVAHLAHGQHLELGEIVLEPGRASVSGITSVVDGRNDPYRIELVGPRRQILEVAAGDRFAFQGLVAGSYRLGWSRPALMPIPRLEDFDLSLDESKTMQLCAEERASLDLHLRDRVGRPFRGIERDPTTNERWVKDLTLQLWEEALVAHAGVDTMPWLADEVDEAEFEGESASTFQDEEWYEVLADSEEPFARCIDRPRTAADSKAPPPPSLTFPVSAVGTAVAKPGTVRVGPLPIRDFRLRVKWGEAVVGEADLLLRSAPLAEYTVVLDVTGD